MLKANIDHLQAVKKLEAEGIPADQLFAGDIVEDAAALKKSLRGADALVIATSGVPQIKPLSLIGVSEAHALSLPLSFHTTETDDIATQTKYLTQAACRHNLTANFDPLQVFWKKLLRQESAQPEFKFKKDQDPEQVPSHHNITCFSARSCSLLESA